jgi:chemotaxis methyl-accepting protein methylase
MAMTYDNFLKEIGVLLELDWRKYRRRSARRHVEERLQELDIPGYEEYLEHLRVDGEEARKLPDLMRVTVSRFFREQACWLDLAEKVIPELLKNKEEGISLRAWCVGCCNGEEPYSLAILYIWALGNSDDSETGLEILATDIDEKVLARALEGCYESSSLREVPSGIVPRYFIQKGRQLCVNDEVGEMVRFEHHNYLEDPVPTGMDLVLCRYLAFTYYRGQRKYRAAKTLWEAIRPSGALMIGRKDIMGPYERELFDPWPDTEVIFRKSCSGK